MAEDSGKNKEGLDPSVRAALRKIDPMEVWASVIETQTSNKDGSCKNKDCYGHVVKEVRSLFRGEYGYDIPRCDKCGRQYTLANDARVVGMKEFNQALNNPMTL